MKTYFSEKTKKYAQILKEIYSNPANHPRYKGGRIKRGKYWYILVKDHPYTTKQGYIAEHRVIMEKHIGRYLLTSEAVHHRDHNPENNSIENLELFSSHGEHTKNAHPEVYAAYKIRFKGVKPPNYNKVIFKCQNCGKDYLRNPNRNGKFCCIKCYWKDKKGKPSKFPEGLKKGHGWNKGMNNPWVAKGKDSPKFIHGKYSKYV